LKGTRGRWWNWIKDWSLHGWFNRESASWGRDPRPFIRRRVVRKVDIKDFRCREGIKEKKYKGVFQPLEGKEKRSETFKLGREGRKGWGVGLKPSIFGIYGSSQIFNFRPEEIIQQAPFWTKGIYLRIHFHNQESVGEGFEFKNCSFAKIFGSKNFNPK